MDDRHDKNSIFYGLDKSWDNSLFEYKIFNI